MNKYYYVSTLSINKGNLIMKLKSYISKFFAVLSLMTISLSAANAGVTNIIPFGPGGESDVTARMQQPITKTFIMTILLFSINQVVVDQ